LDNFKQKISNPRSTGYKNINTKINERNAGKECDDIKSENIEGGGD
jgi:hypothetical protein